MDGSDGEMGAELIEEVDVQGVSSSRVWDEEREDCELWDVEEDGEQEFVGEEVFRDLVERVCCSKDA